VREGESGRQIRKRLSESDVFGQAIGGGIYIRTLSTFSLFSSLLRFSFL
jgi:hypothetical protein